MKSDIFVLARIATVIVLILTTVVAERNTCCENNIPIVGKRCQDGSRVWNLQCPNGGYILPVVSFYLTANDTITTNFSGRVYNRERYCLGSLQTSNETIPEDIAIICIPEKSQIINNERDTNHFIVYILCIISLVSLSLTLVVYLLLPKLRDLQGKCIMITVFNLFMGFLTVTFLHKEGYYTYGTCLLLASSTYFWFLSTFIWMNIVSFNIWKLAVYPNLLLNKKHLFRIYNIYGWSISLTCFAITQISYHVEGNHKKPDWTKISCWFSDFSAAMIYFYGPVFILISSNILMFISTCWKLWRQPQTSPTANIFLKSRRFQCMLYLKLFLIMGVCWIFEPMSFVLYDQGRYLWIVTDYINAMQGVIIFLLLVVFRKRVRRELARRHGRCFQKLPREWATMEDEDCEELNEDSEEMAQDNLARDEEDVQLNQPL